MIFCVLIFILNKKIGIMTVNGTVTFKSQMCPVYSSNDDKYLILRWKDKKNRMATQTVKVDRHDNFESMNMVKHDKCT